MKTLPRKIYQVRVMECGDAEKIPNKTESINTVTQNVTAHRFYTRIHAPNKNGVQQGGSTVGVALSCTFYNDFLVKTQRDKKGAEKNQSEREEQLPLDMQISQKVR